MVRFKLRITKGIWRLRNDFHVWRKPSDYGPKIFIIGMNKTGTTSVGSALKMLGFDHFSAYLNKRPDVVGWFHKDKIDRLIWWASKFDSFDDGPWNKIQMIERLDEKFAGSKFVLLHREKTSYIKSYLTYFAKRPSVVTLTDEELIWEEYCNHRQAVLDYFKGKESQLLDVAVNDSQGFQKLTNFLGMEAIDEAFPHLNKQR